jgi:ribonuclease P protein component
VPKAASVSLHKAADWVTSPTADNRFGRAKRLLNANDYSRVFDGPHARASHQHLLLLAKRNDGPVHRLGLVIAKKNVRSAVHRNRIKRVAREFFRALPCSEPTMDVVLLARRGVGELDNAELSSILQHQWQKLVSHATETKPCTNQDS